MPSKSPAQAKMMRAVAHSPKFAAKVDIPQSVGEEFNAADEAIKPKKKAQGGGQFTLPKSKGMMNGKNNC